MKRITLFVFFATLALASFFAVRSFAGLDATGRIGDDQKKKLIQYLSIIAEKGHYNPARIDDAFAIKVFLKYISSLDAMQDVFLKEDMVQFIPYAFEIDEEMQGKKEIFFFKKVDEVYARRIAEADSMRKKILNKKMDYTQNESFAPPLSDEEEVKFEIPTPLTAERILALESLQMPKTLKEKEERWRKRIKSESLSLYYTSLKQEKEKQKKDSLPSKKTPIDSLEIRARKTISARYDRLMNRLYRHFDENKRFDLYLNSIMSCFDPHSAYFSPVDARSYEESASGKFYGIGALLGMDDHYVKIVSVSTGGAAWKSKQVDPNDLILKVQNEHQDSAIDITGYEVTEAVKLIRGDKGTQVTLTLKKIDGQIKEVTLVRDKIFVNQTFARSGVVDYRGKKMGYIYLPEFYNSMERSDGNNPESTEDMRKELEKLKAQKVDGIILDLRNNGGGYLMDAIKIAGLFIPRGPIVQVKSKESEPEILEDVDNGVTYDGPLLLMTNEYSASASEIVAAAMQDYKRAFIIGAASTFGKGTVQRGGLNVGQIFGENKDLGTVNLTTQKFYRINGQSTQIRGVRPDIILPGTNDYLPVREKDMPFPIAYDSIPSSQYHEFNPQTFQYHRIAQKVYPIIHQSAYYSKITEYAQYLRQHQKSPISLNVNDYQQELNIRERLIAQRDSMKNKIEPLHVRMMKQDSLRFASMDSTESVLFFEWYKALNKDVTLIHTVDIFHDILDEKSPKKDKLDKATAYAWSKKIWLLPQEEQTSKRPSSR